jgi:hypothetical protein
MNNAGNGRVHTYIHPIQEFIHTLSYHVGALVGAEQINDPLNCDLSRPSGYGAIAPNRRVYRISPLERMWSRISGPQRKSVGFSGGGFDNS